MTSADPTNSYMREMNSQLFEYRAARATVPTAFGNRDGFFDNTPSHGPMALVAVWLPTPETARWRIVWGVHKHKWPMDYWYCIGRASDSRGERTDNALMLDIRTLPKAYIGRFQIERAKRCDRRSHQTILGRALADGYDLHAHIAREKARARDEAAARRAAREAAGGCIFCGSTPVEANGECADCNEIPF